MRMPKVEKQPLHLERALNIQLEASVGFVVKRVERNEKVALKNGCKHGTKEQMLVSVTFIYFHFS